MKKSKFFLLIVIIVILLISFIGEKGQLVEQLEIPIGIGYDIEKTTPFTTYSIPMLIHSSEEENSSLIKMLIGKDKSIGEAREKRQLRSGKTPLIGLNRVFIFSQEASEDGLKNYVDICISNPTLNDRAICVVCSGKSEDMLKQKIEGYPNAAEYVEGIVKNAKEYNFFKMQYTIMDIIVRLDSEGRNILLPYVEITKEGIELTGLALFKEDKMIDKVNIDEAKIINLLKEDKVKGMLTIQQDSYKYINCYSTSKRKARCFKEDGKFKFIIDLNIKGVIVSNELNNNISRDSKELAAFEENMKKQVENTCNEMINKMKCKYKVDFLDLGRVAAAKYGRNTGVDWDEIVCDSPISVNVKFKVENEGRGDF